jgi:hypothetical protein
MKERLKVGGRRDKAGYKEREIIIRQKRKAEWKES